VKYVRTAISALLQSSVHLAIEKGEVERACMSISLVGVNSTDSLRGHFLNNISSLVVADQQLDGGWSDVEETVWCTVFLKSANEQSCIDRALGWLRRQQLSDGSWGYSSRDRGRIPITGILLYLVPELANKKSIGWLRETWTNDLRSEPVLSYKAAYVLLALGGQSVDSDDGLVKQTVIRLQKEQNNDGGWGPWKDQPVGSSAEYTGIALSGLLEYPAIVDEKVVTRAVQWLTDNQLPSGLWPAHYIEQGSAWALSGLIKGLQYLQANRS